MIISFYKKKQNEKALVSWPEVGFQDFGKRKLRYSGVGSAVKQISTDTTVYLDFVLQTEPTNT